jgi:putative transposase
MTRPLRIDYPNAFYQVTSRGNECREIFRDNEDRCAFLERPETSLPIYTGRLYVYLTNNQSRFIVETPRLIFRELLQARLTT